MNIFDDLKSLETKVATFLTGIPAESQTVLTKSNQFLNVVKNLVDSTPGQTVIDIAEAFIPGGTAVVSGAEAILNELTGITSETPGLVLLQATQKAANMVTPAGKVSAFSNIATAIASAANDVAKGALTVQQIVSVNQLVHSATALDSPNVQTS